MGTLKPRSNGPLYQTTLNISVVHWPLMGGWAVTFGIGGRGRLRGLRPRPAQRPSRCTKCNSPPIHGQCTNFILFDVPGSIIMPLYSKGLTCSRHCERFTLCIWQWCKKLLLWVTDERFCLDEKNWLQQITTNSSISLVTTTFDRAHMTTY